MPGGRPQAGGTGDGHGEHPDEEVVSADLPRPGPGGDTFADPGCASTGDARRVGDTITIAKALAENVGRHFHALASP